MRGLSAEQLLIIADEFCSAPPGLSAPARVRDFAALAAAAAVPGARVHGVAVHGTTATAADALREAIVRLEPLTARNSEFADVAGEVYRKLARL